MLGFRAFLSRVKRRSITGVKRRSITGVKSELGTSSVSAVALNISMVVDANWLILMSALNAFGLQMQQD